jgi:hypothetical protein
MGRAADNEKVKLRAAFYNNLAVAFLATGIIIPAYAVLYTEQRFVTLGEAVAHRMFWPILTTIGTSLCLAFAFRFLANSLLSSIEDQGSWVRALIRA